MKNIMNKIKNIIQSNKKLVVIIPLVIIGLALIILVVSLLFLNDNGKKDNIYNDEKSLTTAIADAGVEYFNDCLKNKSCKYNVIKDANLKGKITKQYEELMNIKIDDLVASGKLKISKDKVIGAENQNIGPCAITVTKITDFENNKKVTYKVTASFSSYKEKDKTIKCPVAIGEEYKTSDGESHG